MGLEPTTVYSIYGEQGLNPPQKSLHLISDKATG